MHIFKCADVFHNENLANEIANRIVNKYAKAIGELVENLGKL